MNADRLADIRPRHVEQQAMRFAERIATNRLIEIRALTEDTKANPVELLQSIRNIIERD
jgi:hypothetical protein